MKTAGGYTSQAQSGWSSWVGSARRLNATQSSEPVVYELSPLADLQWHHTVEWAEQHGRCEVALHGVGDPATRRVHYFACGLQRACGALCETLAPGVEAIARAAGEAGLRMLCQVHHHPSYVQRRSPGGTPRFFLSGTDIELLDALARDLASGVMRVEPTYQRGSVAVRTGERTHLQLDGRRFELAIEPETRLVLSGGKVETMRGVAEVFVAVTGSDGNLHGKVLRSEICQDCGAPVERWLHPLELHITDSFDEQYLATAFDAGAWAEELDEKVRRYVYYSRSGAAARQRPAKAARQQPRALPAGTATHTRSNSAPGGTQAISAEMTRWLDVLAETAADGADDRAANALEELRALAEDLAARTARSRCTEGHYAHAGGDEHGYDG